MQGQSAASLVWPFLPPTGLANLEKPNAFWASTKTPGNAENAETAENQRKSAEKLTVKCRNPVANCRKPFWLAEGSCRAVPERNPEEPKGFRQFADGFLHLRESFSALFFVFSALSAFSALLKRLEGHPNTWLVGPPSNDQSRKGFRHFTIGFLHLRKSFSALFYVFSALSAFSAFLKVLAMPPKHLDCLPAMYREEPKRFSALWHRISALQNTLFCIFLCVFSTFGIFLHFLRSWRDHPSTWIAGLWGAQPRRMRGVCDIANRNYSPVKHLACPSARSNFPK